MVDQTVEIEDNTGTIDLDKTIETIIFEETPEGTEDKIKEKKYRDNRCNEYNRGRGRSRERTFSRSYRNNRDRSSSNSRSRSRSQASTNRDRIRCYNCREYDHFARDCPNSREERDLEQLQQMLNLEAEEQTHLLTSRQDSHTQKLQESFKLMNGRDDTTTFLPLDSKIGGPDRYNHPIVGQFLNQKRDKVYIQKGGDRGNSEYKHDGTRNRTR